jgi:hypothetical protein
MQQCFLGYTMLYKHTILLFSLFLTFVMVHSQESIAQIALCTIPQEIITTIVTKMDNLAALSVFKSTCKEYNTNYPMHIIIPHLISQYSPQDYTKTLIHYAQKDDVYTFPKIMANETEEFKKIRKNVLKLFGFDNLTHPQLSLTNHIDDSIKVYQGICNLENTHYKNIYLNAAQTNNYNALHILILNKIALENLHALYNRNKTLLIHAAQNNCFGIVELLLTHNYPLKDQQDSLGETALHHAYRRKNSDIAELLIQHGCDDTIKDKRGYTALDIARNNNRKHANDEQLAEEPFPKRRKLNG